MRRPPVDVIRNIQPTLAIRQHNATTQPRSTVATITELSEHLALLFVAIGQIVCEECGEAIDLSPTYLDELRERLVKDVGFEPHMEHFTISGLCDGCRTTESKE